MVAFTGIAEGASSGPPGFRAAANQLTQWSFMQYNMRVIDRLGARAATAADLAQLGLFSAAANPFRIRTSEQSHKCSFQRTYGSANSFRMRTYAKPGRG
jgi:hypothetical protein